MRRSMCLCLVLGVAVFWMIGSLAGAQDSDPPIVEPAVEPAAEATPEPTDQAPEPAVAGEITPPAEPAPALKPAKMFVRLPEICQTPDGMALDASGNILLTCPNYGDKTHPAVIMKIDPQDNCRLYLLVPTHPKTGTACPMGIDVAPGGDIYITDNQEWPGANEGGPYGQILRLKMEDGKPRAWEVTAWNMEHPNGVKVHDGHIYVTHSMITKDPEDGKLISGVYRFKVGEKHIKVENTLDDPNLIATFKTLNPDCQYGADGLVFDSKDNLYVGNFGDATLHKITFDEEGKVTSNEIVAQDTNLMKSIDGIAIDADDNIYVADFSNNSICVVTPEGKVSVLAHNEDCDGADGRLDQPGEPLIRGGQVIVSNFDMVTGPDKLNSGHDEVQHLSVIELGE